MGEITKALAEPGALPTAMEVSMDLHMEPREVYGAIEERAELESMTLEQAADATDSQAGGRPPVDALPASVLSQMGTGIFPPAAQAELDLLKLQNKNASRAECMRKMLETGSLTLADTKGYRTRTAYRLIRHMAFIRGVMDGHDMLQVILNMAQDEDGISLWQLPMPLMHSRFLTGNRAVRAVLHAIDREGETYLFNTPRGLFAFEGSTTLPPPIPDRFYPRSPRENWKARINRKVPADYDVAIDRPLILFCEAMTLVAEMLNVPRGAPEEPWAGLYGLAGLLNPYTARVAWPTRDELVMYEEEFMLKIWDKAALSSTRATEEWVQQFFGYSRLEALDIVKTAVLVGSMLYSEGGEEMRALELKRLDSLEDKCDLASDPRAILATKRLKFQVLGLTNQEEQEGMKDIRDAAIAGIQSVQNTEEE